MNCYLHVRKSVLKPWGANFAIFFAALSERYYALKELGRLSEDGKFEYSVEDMEAATGLSEKDQFMAAEIFFVKAMIGECYFNDITMRCSDTVKNTRSKKRTFCIYEENLLKDELFE